MAIVQAPPHRRRARNGSAGGLPLAVSATVIAGAALAVVLMLRAA